MKFGALLFSSLIVVQSLRAVDPSSAGDVRSAASDWPAAVHEISIAGAADGEVQRAMYYEPPGAAVSQTSAVRRIWNLPAYTFEKPVYVDLLSGRVFEIPATNWSKNGTAFLFKGIPLYDSPILIADKSALGITLKKDH